MKLTQSEWIEIASYLDEGLDLPVEQRAAWIESLPGLDPGLRQNLRGLLCQPLRDDFLQTLPRFAPELEDGAPAEIGQYQLIREIGRGGMAAVWLAQRSDGLLRRQVALKLPHSGTKAAWFLKRFAQEREILASLTHPNIARLYDAGVAEGERPFIALEYVDGAPITEYCDGERMGVRERLALFLKVLAAVQYAHAHLVLHRDLKPSNILVAEGEVKLLDFGIAKLMSGGETRETELTELGGRAMTLDYASPEQISGQPMSIASDVYSLGVVLFELLCGDRPYAPKRDSRGALEDAILAGDTARLRQMTSSEAKARERATTPRKLAAALKGDLDKIVAKAMRKVPAQRYVTADAFAGDLGRYLRGEPVLAQPESAAYRVKKFVLRHRLAVAASALTVLALGSGLAIALEQTRVAQREARTSEAVEEFLTDIFRANTSSQQNPVKARETTARELLDIGASKIDGELNNSPQAKARLLATLSGLYDELGLDDQAVSLGRKNVALARHLYGRNDSRVADALASLAGAMHSSSFVNEEQAVLEEAAGILDRRGDRGSLTRAIIDVKLGELYYSTDLDKALEYARQAVAIYRTRPPTVDFVEALYGEGLLHNGRAEYGQAAAVLQEAIGISRKLEGEPNPSLPRLYAYLGESQNDAMEFAEAERSLRAALAAATAVNGENHVDTIQTTLRLGVFLGHTSRPFQALQYLQTARDKVLKIRGANDPFHTPQVMLEYGVALARTGLVEAGLDAIDTAIENRRKNRPGTRYLATMLEYRANVLLEVGAYPEARSALDEASDILKKTNDKSDWMNTYYRAKLALDTADDGEALRLIDSEPVAEPGGKLSQRVLRDTALHAMAALARRDAAGAVREASNIRQQIAASTLRPYLQEWEAGAALLEGRGYLMAKQAGQALPVLEKAVELRAGLSDPTSLALADAYLCLAECRATLGQSARAHDALAKARQAFASHPRVGNQHLELLREAQAGIAGVTRSVSQAR